VSLDDIHEVHDYSEITLRALIDRLQRSSSDEQFIYRESELDEMWRIVDIELGEAEKFRRPECDTLRDIRTAIMAAHDLVGMEGRPLEAAERLRAIKLQH
jgi:hypothetical protein